MFPRPSSQRTVGNQAQLRLGRKDRDRYNSPFSCSPRHPSLSHSLPLFFPPHLAGFSRQAMCWIRLADSAGILALNARCSDAISRADHSQRNSVKCYNTIYWYLLSHWLHDIIFSMQIWATQKQAESQHFGKLPTAWSRTGDAALAWRDHAFLP